MKVIKKEILSSTIRKMNYNNLETYFDNRLANRYYNAKIDHGVIGSGKATYDTETDILRINYTEDGVEKTYSIDNPKEYTMSQLFDIRSEQAE